MTVLDYVLLVRTPYLGFFAVEAPTDLDITNDVLGSLDLRNSFSSDRHAVGGSANACRRRALAHHSGFFCSRAQTALDIDISKRCSSSSTAALGAVSRSFDDARSHDAAQYPDRLALLSAGRVVTVARV